MPQGGNNNGLGESAISMIEQWIKAGALLDAGLDPKAAMETYAAPPEQVRRMQIARMSPKERDQKIEAAGRDRWKKANPKLKPEITPASTSSSSATCPRTAPRTWSRRWRPSTRT